MSKNKFIKPATLKMDPKMADMSQSVVGKGAAADEHDYAMEVTTKNKRDRGEISAPTTPSKQPVEKKTKASEDAESSDVSNAAILTAIQGLESRVNDQLTELKEQAKQTSTMLASLAKAVQFNAEQMKECKKRVKDLEEQNE